MLKIIYSNLYEITNSLSVVFDLYPIGGYVWRHRRRFVKACQSVADVRYRHLQLLVDRWYRTVSSPAKYRLRLERKKLVDGRIEVRVRLLKPDLTDTVYLFILALIAIYYQWHAVMIKREVQAYCIVNSHLIVVYVVLFFRININLFSKYYSYQWCRASS